MPCHYAIREALEDRLAVLRRRIGAVERELRRHRDPDSEERALEAENDEVLEGLDDEGRREIARIEAAIARIEDGSFGVCEKCSEPISADRLEAVPFVATCRDCAR